VEHGQHHPLLGSKALSHHVDAQATHHFSAAPRLASPSSSHLQESHESHFDAEKWADSLFVDEPDEATHHQHLSPATPRKSVSPQSSHSPSRPISREGSEEDHDRGCTESDAELDEWMSSIFSEGPHDHKTLGSPQNSPGHHTSGAGTLGRGPLPSHGISLVTPTLSATPRQGYLKNGAVGPSRVERKVRRERKSQWTSRYEPYGRDNVRKGLDEAIIAKHGSTSAKRRFDLINKLDQRQRDHLSVGGSFVTLPPRQVSKTNNPASQAEPWTFDFKEDEVRKLEHFADLVMSFRNGFQKSTRNTLMAGLSRQELLAVTEDKEQEKKAILTRLMPKKTRKRRKE
jgi:hypothetical protein